MQTAVPMINRSAHVATVTSAARIRLAPYLGATGNLQHTLYLALASWMLGHIVVRLITHVPFVPLRFCSPCSLVIILL